MCMIKCDGCKNIVDTDDDPASLDVAGYDEKCFCETCRAEIEEDNYGGDMYDSDRAEHGTHS